LTSATGRLEATFRPAAANSYVVRSRLFLFDHTTVNAGEISVDLPENLVEDDPPRTILVEALAGRKVLTQARAPDGYQLESRSQRGPGIVGELFGMNRYSSEALLVNKGRVIQFELPPPFRIINLSPVSAVAWLVPELNNGQR